MLSLPRCKPALLPLGHSSLTRRITSSLGQSSSARSFSRSRRKRQSTPKRFSSNRKSTATVDDDPDNLDLERYSSSSSPAPSTMPVKREPSAAVLATWRSAKAVCFDVDSTLCTDESIDEIAAFLGVGEQVAALTSQAMGGSTKFEDALAARLGLMKPSRAQLEQFIQKNPPKLSPGIPELVRELQDRGTKVFLVSGGFRAVIEPIADSLNIPRSHVFANSILFDAESGEYAGFDPKEHTSRSGGKLAAVQAIRKEHQEKGSGEGEADGVSSFPIVAVGDGATDAEAVSADGSGADIFIGYGGVVERAVVAERADWFVKSIQELRDALHEKEKGGEENGVTT